MRRTLVCLAAKRSGTTAVHRVFAAHPGVGIGHPDQTVDNQEPDFWYFAEPVLARHEVNARGAEGYARWCRFDAKLATLLPGRTVEPPLTRATVMDLWTEVVDRYGPVVFDKSPKYLGSRAALQLLLDYADAGNDVRFFAIVRHPLDTIASQHALWTDEAPAIGVRDREARWVDYHETLDWFREKVGPERCPVYRYEDLSAEPARTFSALFDHCGIAQFPAAHAHIRPVSVGRHRSTDDPDLLAWMPGERLRDLARRYGYEIEARPLNVLQPKGMAKRTAERPPDGVSMRARVLWWLTDRLAGRLPPRVLESLVQRLIMRTWRRFDGYEGMRFALRLHTALESLSDTAAIEARGGTETLERFSGHCADMVHWIETGERVLVLADDGGLLARRLRFWSAAGHVGEGDPKIWPVTRGTADAADTVVVSRLLEKRGERSRALRALIGACGARRLILLVPSAERDWRIPLKRDVAVEWRMDKGHRIEYTSETLAFELESAGLRIVDARRRWGDFLVLAASS